VGRKAPVVNELIEALGRKYLLRRPEFVNAHKKAKKAGFDLTPEQYRALLADVKNLKQLFKLTDVDETKHEILDFTVNQWSRGNTQVKARLRPKSTKQPLVRPEFIPPVVTIRKPKKTGMEVMCIPDTHIGYFEEDGCLHPTHNPTAMALIVEAARYFQPKVVIFLGDLLDLPTFSTFLQDPSHRQVCNWALQTAVDFLKAVREACPRAEILFIQGNHEERIAKMTKTFLPELQGLKRPGEDEALLSVSYLLRLTEMNIAYIGPYGEHHFRSGVRYMHGELIGAAGGLTVAKLLKEYAEDTVTGHVHRLEVAFRTWHRNDEIYYTYAMDCGTLARIDGKVPGPRYPDWQLGFGSIWFGNEPHVFPIRGDMMSVMGIIFSANATLVDKFSAKGDAEAEDE